MDQQANNDDGATGQDEATSSQELVDELNSRLPVCLHTLNGSITGYDGQSRRITMAFDIPKAFCHSVDVVQGGFVTAMLDAAMSHAVFAVTGPTIRPPATLEIKVSFLAPARAGRLIAHGHVIHAGRSTCFLEGDLEDEDGNLLARATSTARVIPLKPPAARGAGRVR